MKRRLVLALLAVASLAWGGWTALLVDEYVRDYWGHEWNVGAAEIGFSVAVLVGLLAAIVVTWRRRPG